MFLNVQVILKKGLTANHLVDRMPDPLKILARTSYVADQIGNTAMCWICGGSGTLIRDDTCRKCSGVGSLLAVEVLRVEFLPQESLYQPLIEWYDFLRQEKCNVQVTARLAENGGGYTNTGRATIICGLNGECLKSIYGRAVCNEDHAIFYAFTALQIEYSQHRGLGSGKIYVVGIDSPHVDFRKELVFEFGDDLEFTQPVNTRHNLVFPTYAATMAIEKARCYHCRQAYYASGNYADDPSGALTGAGAAYGGLSSPFKGPGIGYDPT